MTHDPDHELRLCRRCGANFKHIPIEELPPCELAGSGENTVGLLYLTRRRDEIARRRLIRELKELGC